MDYDQIEQDLRDWPVTNVYAMRGAEAISALRAETVRLRKEIDKLEISTGPCIYCAKEIQEPDDSAAYNGWVLRDVLFVDGEPVSHRAPKSAN